MADKTSEPPVITETQAARIRAKAWAEYLANRPAFKNNLDTDPAKAIDLSVRASFRIPDNARLIDLEYTSGGRDYQHLPQDRLLEIYTYGTDGGTKVEMDRSEWVPLSGPSKPIDQKLDGISLQNWARIYAYIWYQANSTPPDTTFKDLFENDPVTTLTRIIPILNSLPSLPSAPPRPPRPAPIDYVAGKTPLITHGDPPPVPGSISGFDNIENDLQALGYKYRIRYCC